MTRQLSFQEGQPLQGKSAMYERKAHFVSGQALVQELLGLRLVRGTKSWVSNSKTSTKGDFLVRYLMSYEVG